MGIKGLIFDCGGVFSDGGSFRPFINDYAKRHNINVQEFSDFFHKVRYLASINITSSGAFWEEVATFLQEDPGEFRSECIGYFNFNFEVLELAKKLKRNYRLGLLSNNIEDWLEENLDGFGMRGLFDVVVASYSSGVKKPDVDIYLEMLAKLRLSPEMCIFIDDPERNLVPARNLGIETVLFKDASQVTKELLSRGIRL